MWADKVNISFGLCGMWLRCCWRCSHKGAGILEGNLLRPLIIDLKPGVRSFQKPLIVNENSPSSTPVILPHTQDLEPLIPNASYNGSVECMILIPSVAVMHGHFQVQPFTPHTRDLAPKP